MDWNPNYPKFSLATVPKILVDLNIKSDSRYLMNREKLGIPLRRFLVNQLKTMEGGTLVINMEGVEEVTTSVAEEIGPLLFQDFLELRSQGREVFFTYCNVSEEISRGLDGTFKNFASDIELNGKFTAIIFSTYENSCFINHQFVGQEIPSALKEVLDVIYDLGVVNSSDLEMHGVKAASRKLNELAKHYPWLFSKVQKSLDTSVRAWAYFYAPIVPINETQGVM